jgi:hypothetical protein
MTAVTIGKLLEATEAALIELREGYETVRRRDPDSSRGMLAGLLSQREASTIATFNEYREPDEGHAALDVHVRLGGGFPLDDGPHVPDDPQIEELLAIAEETDNALEQLHERVGLYAAGAELHAAFSALDALVRRRRQQLASAARELEEFVSGPPRDS